MRNSQIVGIAVALVVVLAVVYLFFFTGSQPPSVAKEGQQYTVNVSQVTQADIPNTVPALGTFVAPDLVTISSDVDGRVKSIHFKNGSNVTKGMPIINLDAEQAHADYNTAVTQYNLAKLIL